jgi:uncharacterized protein (TIGR02646 family)
MHLLQRGPAPDCLAQYSYKRHSWSKTSPTDAERVEIRAELETMQGRRCAYCECSLDQHGHHIEHFRQRSRFDQGTFDWNNLFLSCERLDSCGKHKDSCGNYDPGDLIKPDEEDPEDFFVFGSDGTINLRDGLTPAQTHRASETLRIFNLDAQWGPLRQMRKVVCQGYIEDANFFLEMSLQCPQDEWWPLYQEELSKIKELPFYTAIKHTLLPA